MAKASKIFRVGTIGYGGAFNMGKTHLESIRKNPNFVPAAVCDLDAKRVEVAHADFPGIETYTNVAQMLKKAKLDLVIIITPHNTHAPLAIQCLKAGVGVVVEKPMAITTKEVTAMCAEAKKRKLFLSTFHNRRWDGDYMALKKLIADDTIGRVFRIEAGFYGYLPQGKWWRSIKQVSGGNVYDWGAHFTDWILGLKAEKITSVQGMTVKNAAWAKDYTNEDHSEVHVHFADGCWSTLTISNLAAVEKNRWVICGERGSITAGQDKWIVKEWIKGRLHTYDVPFEKSNWDGYYANVTAHLTTKEKLSVTPESAARVIGVLDTALASAAKGGVPLVPKVR
jgi:scyllo-inositol 2-dehydrogenase (NADP+)